MTRSTQKDVARAIGVSDMTVSRVLTGRGTVSVRTREKVLAAVEAMGYVRNRMAGSLALSRSNQVGVVLPSMRVGIFPEVLAGITQELEKAGYNPVIGVTDYDIDREESLVESLLSWNAAGIIVNDFVHTNRTKKLLEKAGVPVVEIMQLSGDPIRQCVGFDHAEAACALVDHLLARGYSRFGYLGWHGTQYAASVRFAGVRDHLRAQGYALVAPSMFDAPPNVEEGRVGLAKLLEQKSDVDAVIFGNDLMAVGAVFYCDEIGVKVPDDLAIAGFGGLDIGLALPKKLTTIRFPRLGVGQRAARAILNSMAGQTKPKVTDMKFELIEGETS
ncbi:MAG: LacI family DNA-binding transcriptional regulator [Cohaesibacteraceae bacterium]